MILFPWLVALLLMVMVAELVLVLPQVSRGLFRERRLSVATRPTLRAVTLLTLVQLAIVLVLGLVVLVER